MMKKFVRTNEGDPKILWTFLNIADISVAWETYRGVLISADCYDIENKPSLSSWQIRYLRTSQSPNCINELRLEYVRQQYYPDKISRFRGFYYFEDKNTAINAAKVWGSGHFNTFCLTEVGIDPSSPFSKMDSNWITYNKNILSDNWDWMHKYWQGISFPNKEPIWELLVVTRGLIYNRELREQAYENIKKSHPLTILPMLEQARLASWLNSDLGHGCPYITQTSEKTFEVGYIMDMRDAKNTEYTDKLKNYVNNPANKEFINFADLSLIDRYDVFSLPDLSFKNFTFSINKLMVPEFNINNMNHLH